MNRYDTGSFTSSLWKPTTQTHDLHQNRYHSPFEHSLDPIAIMTAQLARRTAQLWNSDQACEPHQNRYHSPFEHAYDPVAIMTAQLARRTAQLWNSRERERSSWKPASQTRELTQTRYHSPHEYTCDPIIAKTSQNWNSEERERSLWKSIPQTYEPSGTRYHSVHEYACDPKVTKTAQFWNSREWEKEYSSRKKAYYPVVPYNTQSSHLMPVVGHFDFTRLKQTNVLDIVYFQHHLSDQFGVVSLAHTISPLLSKMGTMTDLATKESLGTCTLISHNLVLVARHAVEGRNVRNINITFGQVEFNGAIYDNGRTSFDCIIEEDALCDYAIIRLKEPLGERLGFVPLNIEGLITSEPALLHYPLGKPLQVSVHTFVQTEYETDYLLAYHDSDYFSSGGAYFDPMGRMIAMHLGSQLQNETTNLCRYALPLERVVKQKTHSLLGKFANGKLSQAHSYMADSSLIYLTPTNHNFLIDKEGRESEKILRGLLKNELKKDKNIKKTKSGLISFSGPNLEYIANKYKSKFKRFEEKCLGITGLHGFTRLYSVKEVIESDHTIPHNVWKSTTNPKMKKLLDGRGTRQGEDEMPAITLPHSIHRNLLTTGGVVGCKAFHQTLIDLCNADKIDKALIKCYQEYETKGLDLKAYKKEITQSLQDHIKLGLISNVQKKKIIKAVF